MKISTIVLSLGLAACTTLLLSQQTESGSFSPHVTPEGEISLPLEYRSDWTHLGSYAVLDEAAGHGLHEVYTEKPNITAYQQTGEWPDGAMLIKEVRHSDGQSMTTGDAHWASTMNVWFVMVKDQQGRFPDNELWGDGWGWALFKGDDPTTQAATNYKTDCLSCHIPAKDNDWVYTEGYPLLRDDPFAAPDAEPEQAHSNAMPADLTGGSAESGAEVFNATCKVCHNADSTERKFGPGLAAVADGTLPSGKEATPENIYLQITNGGNGMPSFEDALSDAEKADLIAYLTASK